MALNTDLNVTPYYDDFSEDKNFHKVIFKAGVGVQARELTQLQTILQNQIERFGTNILIEGTIVKGGNFNEIRKFPYVKILDNNTSDQTVVIDNYIGATLVGQNTGVTATVITTIAGFETQAPDLNTLYIKYTSTGQDALGNDVKTFLPGEVLEVSIDGNVDSTLEVAVASLGVDSAPIGNGYGVKCSDGIIFQKGFFVRFDEQTTVVSKYTSEPDSVVVGFFTEEEVVNSNADTSLLDNAQGFDNYNAPGADRMKLTPKLIKYTYEQAAADEHFLPIQEYQNGKVVRRRTQTQFNSISKLVEQRTSEESGDYTVSEFDLKIREHDTDNTKLNIGIGSGIAYVKGKRVENLNYVDLELNKSIEERSIDQQDILANYGNYIIVEDFVGSLNIASNQSINLRSAPQVATSLIGFTAVGSVIGTASVRSLIRHDATSYRVYIFNIKMNSGQSFVDVRSITSSLGFGNLILESGRAVVKDASFNTLVFPIGKSAIKTIIPEETDYIARKKIDTTIGTTGQFSINLSGGEQFPYGANATLNSDALSEIIISDTDNGEIHVATSGSVDSSGTSLTLNIGVIPGTINASVIFNSKITEARPIGKELVTVYMRINPTGNLNGPYALGWPDVYSIEGIWKGANTTFTEVSAGITEVTNNFVLKDNKKDGFYDISYIQKRGLTLTASDRLLVKAKVFKKVTTGAYSQSFFSVDSYPVDDVTDILPANKIRTENIPGELRDAIDFRPYATNNAAYAEDASLADIWTISNTLDDLSFGSTNLNLIAPNRSVEAAYTYYLARKDLLLIDKNGDFAILEGIPAEEPVFPNEPKNGMILAKLSIPPYPSLPSSIANRSGTPEYGVTITKASNKGYTMKDIGDIEKRLDRIEYYTVLNALEKSAEDMVITDENGLTRFKNGILTDDFTNMLISDVTNDDFGAAVDPMEGEMTPRFRSYNLELKISNTTNSQVTANTVVTLPYDHQIAIRQQYATKFRNCVTDFYRFNGSAQVYPAYDGGQDVTYAPDITLEVDLATPFIEYTKKVAQFVPLSSRNVKKESTVVSSNTTITTGATSRTTTTNQLIKDVTTIDTKALKISSKTTTQEVGDFVTNVQFNPYLRSKILRIHASGLRPNTQFYFYFDGKSVNQHVARARLSTNNLKDMKRTSAFGATTIRSDSDGVLNVMFKIPAQTFYVGDRDFLIVDVDQLNSEDSATSAATVTYRGYNFSIEKTGLELATREPDVSVKKTRNVLENTRVVTSSSTVSTASGNPAMGDGDDTDPIAQTFLVNENLSDDTHIMVTKVAVAFKAKSATQGITLELRNTVNGYPGKKTLAFGRVIKRSSDISVSDNGSVMTEFVFDSPIALKTGEEYTIVLLPHGNSPDYNVFVAKTGEVGLQSGVRITSDVNSGTLFTSTNNSAWTPYQDENMKFTIYKANFNQASGSVNLTNKDHEFFDLTSYSGSFQGGEKVFKVNTNAAGTVSTQEDSNVITGVGTSFNTYFTVGDYIAFLDTGSTYELAKIVTINSATSMIVDEFAKVTRTGRTYFKTIAGEVSYFNENEPARLILEESSAKSTMRFQNGDVIRGEISEALAEISEVVNLPISYFQPNIYRTNFTRTKTNLAITIQSSETSRITTTRPIAFNDNIFFNNVNTVIKSRSNEINDDSGAKSFELKVDLENSIGSGIRNTSPIIDAEICSITPFEYFINPLTDQMIASEVGNNGESESKYISKVVELADGFDAEDLKVWVTAYRPPNTDITVYAKFKSSSDVTATDEVAWTQLKLVASKNFTSSVANKNDFKEFEYYLDTTVLGAGEGAYLNGGEFEYQSIDGAIHKNFKFFAIKILMNSDGQSRIPRLKDMRAIALT